MISRSTEAELHALIDDRVKALHSRDLRRLMLNVAQDVVTFDVVDPLQRVGAAEARRRGEEWFASFDGPIGYEVRELSITVAEEIAYSHSLNHVTGTLNGGQKVDMWLRETLCWRKQGGAWQVTHQHGSVPFDPASGKASLELEP